MTDPYAPPKTDPTPEEESPKRRQTLPERVAWFLVGGVVGYLLIALPFKYLKTHTDLSIPAMAVSSVAVSTSFFFFWNYFVNFRTNSRKRDALARYIVAVLALAATQSTLLTIFKHFDVLRLKSVIDLDVLSTQACMGWLKFIAYHKWVFPRAKVVETVAT